MGTRVSHRTMPTDMAEMKGQQLLAKNQRANEPTVGAEVFSGRMRGDTLCKVTIFVRYTMLL